MNKSGWICGGMLLAGLGGAVWTAWPNASAPVPVSQTQVATQDSLASPFPGESELCLSEPAPLPATTPAEQAMASRLIDQELNDAGEAEKEIWREETADLPPRMLAEILRIRQSIGPAVKTVSLESTVDEAAEPATQAFLPESVDPPPACPPVEAANPLSPQLERLQGIRRVLLENITHHLTPGYRKTRVIQGTDDARGFATQVVHSQGLLQETGLPYDLAIEGYGYFTLKSEQGQLLYTRAGAFRRGSGGQLESVVTGLPLEPAIVIPADAAELQVSQAGVVSVLLPGQEQPQPIGQLELTRFIHPEGLEQVSPVTFRATSAAGHPVTEKAGICARIHHGNLERSNVDIEDELKQLQEINRLLQLLTGGGVDAPVYPVSY